MIRHQQDKPEHVLAHEELVAVEEDARNVAQDEDNDDADEDEGEVDLDKNISFKISQKKTA